MAVSLLSKRTMQPKSIRVNGYNGKPAIETLTNGYFIVDSQWTVKYWNKSAEKLLGVSSKDIIGKNLWQQFATSIPVEFYAFYYKAFLHDIPVHFQEYWSEMGAWFDVTTWHSEDTLCVSFKSSNQPYPENPDNPQERLKTLTELYRYVTEITNDCLWEWDLTTNEIFWIDGGHKRAFGYPVENTLVPERFWKSCIHPDDRNRVVYRLNRIISAGQETVWEDEYRFKKKDGDYCYVHDRGHILYDENNKAIRIIGATQDINKRVILEKKIALQVQQQQEIITAAVLKAQENERAIIGKEIHDNLGQILVVAKLYMQMAKGSIKNSEVSIDKSVALMGEVILGLRKIAKQLVIPSTQVISLFDNIKNLIADLNLAQTIIFHFTESDIIEDEIQAELQITIFRIIQEQTNNILRHSKATNASINLSKQGKELKLFITDDGRGPYDSTEKNGVGLINIKSRVQLSGGTVFINSQTGNGFQLTAFFPLNRVSI